MLFGLFGRKEDKILPCDEFCVSLSEGSNPIPQTNSEIFIGSSHNSKNIYKKSTLLSLTSDKIKGTLVARSRCFKKTMKMQTVKRDLEAGLKELGLIQG